ncbi:MAG: GldG family protein, partial [Pseudomonadota bacterium]
MNKEKTFYPTLLGALVVGLFGLVALYLAPEISLLYQIFGGLFLALSLAHFILNISSYKNLFKRRTTQLGLQAVTNAVLVLAIIVVLNLIVGNYDIKKDITKNKIHTLSEQSIKVLDGLSSEIYIKAFVNPTQVQEFENIFSKYTYQSKKLKREFIDVDKDPLAVQKYSIRTAGTVVIESGDRSARVENLSGPDDPKLEEKLTNAIISVTKGGKKKLYSLSGHGERLLSDAGREGFSEMKAALENGRYQVEEISLLEKGEVPSDAEILMVAGPKTEFMPHEYQALEKFLRAGGKMLFMVEPNSPKSVREFLLKFGVDWKPQKVILETNTLQQLAGGNPLTPIINNYDRSHEITRDSKQLTLFPVSTPVEKLEKTPEGVTATSLFSSSARSLETDLQGDKVKVNQATDKKGPLSLAVAVSAPLKKEDESEKTSELRLVVVGDSDFATNQARQFGMNADLFQNMLSWLAQEEDLIAIRPKSTSESQFDITEQRSRIINLASIVIAPLFMFVFGIS